MTPSDGLSVVLFFVSYTRIEGVREAARKRAALQSRIDSDREVHTLSGQWTAEMESAAVNLEHALAREAFSGWFSERTPVAVACGALISLACGISTVPGAVAGFLIASPRTAARIIRTFAFFRKQGRK